jgi:hypothetical protein
MSKIIVEGVDINIVSQNQNDYISLTDMVKANDDDTRAADIIKNWVRTRTTIEFLGVWETIYNPDFKVVEFDHFRKQAGLPTFTMSISNWVEKTGSIGVFSKSGKYGGTYAHKDIAFQFGMWMSPRFQLLLVKEFQRLKEEEQKRLGSEWDYKRFLAKANYSIHTDAVKTYVVPAKNLSKDKEWIAYAEEADILNVSLFGYTAKQWRDANPDLHLKGLNIRDIADAHQLLVLSNMESLNSTLLEHGIDKYRRLLELKRSAESQLTSLRKSSYTLEKIQSPFLTTIPKNNKLN